MSSRQTLEEKVVDTTEQHRSWFTSCFSLVPSHGNSRPPEPSGLSGVAAKTALGHRLLSSALLTP